jgi:hypothetical protein
MRDRGTSERDVITHLVDIAAFAAKIGLHIDDEKDRIVRSEVTVIGIGIGVGCNVPTHGSPLDDLWVWIFDSSLLTI